MPIRYSTNADDAEEATVAGFFVGWPNPPSEQTLMRILKSSAHVALAFDGQKLVGFCTAVSDGVLAAFVPLLEVLPEYQRQGIGTRLVQRVHDQLSDLYSTDLVCDDDMVPFYERLGFQRMTAMAKRNYAAQSGKS